MFLKLLGFMPPRMPAMLAAQNIPLSLNSVKLLDNFLPG